MKENTLTQVSTLNALMMGDYYGAKTVESLLEEGDTGIGTYEGLDGEAIFFKGHAYNGRADGKVYEMDKNAKVPFATVSKFDENEKEEVISFSSIEDLKEKLTSKLESKNHFYMLKMEGIFSVRVRSCYKQETPYEPLYKVACDQREFPFEDLEGYVIGVYCPNYVAGMNLPGWHIHFLSKDLSKGGHILKLSGKDIRLKLNKITKWNLILPENEDFETWNLAEDLKEKTEATEGSRK